MKLNIVNLTNYTRMDSLTRLLTEEIPKLSKHKFEKDIEIVSGKLSRNYWYSKEDINQVPKFMHEDQDAVLYLCKSSHNRDGRPVLHDPMFSKQGLEKLVEIAQDSNPETKIIFGYQPESRSYEDYRNDILYAFKEAVKPIINPFKDIVPSRLFLYHVGEFKEDYEHKLWCNNTPEHINVFPEPIKLLKPGEFNGDYDVSMRYLESLESLGILKIVTFLNGEYKR